MSGSAGTKRDPNWQGRNVVRNGTESLFYLPSPAKLQSPTTKHPTAKVNEELEHH